jgi:pimeloyl-ACP methyl ester carboxylesterase
MAFVLKSVDLANEVRLQYAEQDALTSAIAGSRLLVYQGAGHLLHWEEPQRFASDLLTFVEGLRGRR